MKYHADWEEERGVLRRLNRTGERKTENKEVD